MMTSETAKEMLAIAGDILELSGKYRSAYKRLPTVDTPPEGWQLYDVIQSKQKEIAQKLDKNALEITWTEILKHFSAGQHLKRFSPRSGMDEGTALQLVEEIGRLIYRCNYRPDNQIRETMVLKQQRIIAELLNPEVFK